MNNNKLTGIVPPLITPLIDNETLDIEGLEKLIEHVLKGGVHGVFILGTTGEASSLSLELSIHMIRETSRILQGRVPLLVGISDTSIVDSILLAKIAHEEKADAVVSTPPFYFSLNQKELIEYYETLLSQIQLPLYLYNIPSNTKISFEPKTIRKIAKNHQVIGFKDSSGNATYLQSVMHEMRDYKSFSIFVGPEEMTAEMILLGADGGVNGGANIFPQLYVDLYNAAKTANIEEVRKLQAILMKITTSIYTVGGSNSSYLKGVKSSLGILGICSDFVASPLCKFVGAQKNEIESFLNDALKDI